MFLQMYDGVFAKNMLSFLLYLSKFCEKMPRKIVCDAHFIIEKNIIIIYNRLWRCYEESKML